MVKTRKRTKESEERSKLPKSEEPGMILKTLSPIFKYTLKWEIQELSKINMKEQESPMFEVEPDSVWYAYLFKKNDRIYLKLNWYSSNVHSTVNYNVRISDSDDKELYHKSDSFAHDKDNCVFNVFDTKIDGKIKNPPKDTLVFKIDLAVIGEITENVPLDYPPQPNITLRNALETEFLQSDEAKDVKVVEDVKDTKDIEDAKDTKDVEDTKHVEDVKDTKHVEDVKDTKDVEDVKDTKTKSIFFINLLSSMSIRNAKELEETSLTELRDILASVNNKLLKDVDVDHVTGLYEVAGEYSLDDLKKDCERALLSKVNSDNAERLFDLLKE